MTLPILTTERLKLRERTADDAEALFPSFSDGELMTYWSHAPHASVDETRARFAVSHAGWRAWTITLAGDDTAIGFVAIGEKKPKVSELGYMLARPHWGRGLAREAVAAALDHVFRGEGQRRVFADTDPDNGASNAL